MRDEVNERVVAQHAAIVDAIEAGDPPAAAQAMVEHLRYVRETLTVDGGGWTQLDRWPGQT